jgi:hypothetical protein
LVDAVLAIVGSRWDQVWLTGRITANNTVLEDDFRQSWANTSCQLHGVHTTMDGLDLPTSVCVLAILHSILRCINLNLPLITACPNEL